MRPQPPQIVTFPLSCCSVRQWEAPPPFIAGSLEHTPRLRHQEGCGHAPRCECRALCSCRAPPLGERTSQSLTAGPRPQVEVISRQDGPPTPGALQQSPTGNGADSRGIQRPSYHVTRGSGLRGLGPQPETAPLAPAGISSVLQPSRRACAEPYPRSGTQAPTVRAPSLLAPSCTGPAFPRLSLARTAAFTPVFTGGRTPQRLL